MTVSPVRIFVVVFLWLLLMLGIGGYYFWSWMNTPHSIPDEHQELVVERGESLRHIAHRLHQKDILRWPRVWSLYARMFEPESVKAGEFLLPERVTPLEVLRQLQAGEVVMHGITFVEGKTFTDMLNTLSSHEKLEHQLRGLAPDEVVEKLGLSLDHPEGWFFPDTYYYVNGDSDAEILLRAHQRMKRVLELEWRARAVGLPYETPYEALVMASIIEKETGVPEERDEIAGVFVRRLQQGMRLQTDPTVIYGMGDAYEGNLRRSDLRTASPYNTYTQRGLPPTPIAMPGREAIHAALHPAQGDSLYFVARGDGTHYFSATLEEHVEAVRRYQKSGRRSDYRSAPPSTPDAGAQGEQDQSDTGEADSPNSAQPLGSGA